MVNSLPGAAALDSTMQTQGHFAHVSAGGCKDGMIGGKRSFTFAPSSSAVPSPGHRFTMETLAHAKASSSTESPNLWTVTIGRFGLGLDETVPSHLGPTPFPVELVSSQSTDAMNVK